MSRIPHLSRALSVIAGLALTGLTLLFITRAWDEDATSRPGPIPDIAEPLTGNDLAPWALPTALVSGAAILVLLAVGPTLRRLMLLLVAIASLGPLSGGIVGIIEQPGIWPIATSLTATALLIVALAGWRSAPHWLESTSSNETGPDADTDASLSDPVQIWKALDAGDDPTSSSISPKAAKEEKPR